MNPYIVLFLLCIFHLLSCSNNDFPAFPATIDHMAPVVHSPHPEQDPINEAGSTITERFPIPEGFARVKLPSTSFGYFLRNLPLKPHGAVVHTYNGRIKPNNGIYTAVVDLDIGHKNLHQCADAIMRLRADYLWQAKRYDNIHFNFTNGFCVDYSKWRAGQRVVIDGNKTYWKQKAVPSDTYESYWKYLELIFAYAGTASLSKELKGVDLNSLTVGDVFIEGGHPGHAVIVVDVCEAPQTGVKQFLLAQSYMPAQELQILSNPNRRDGSPWYTLPVDGQLETPEWNFGPSSLKRFEN